MIELRVVKTVEKVNRSRSGCCHADAGLAGEFRVCAGHECGHLLVAHLDEIDFAFGALERAHDAVDSVAGVAVDAPHAPFAQPPDQKVARCLSHGLEPSMTCTSRWDQVRENKPVASNDLSGRDGDRRAKHRAVVSEGVKFAAFAAWIG